MPQNKRFGTTSVNFGDRPVKQRIIVGDLNIVFAKKDIVVIYFTKQNEQKVEIFSGTEALSKFINNFLENKGE